MRVFLAWSGNLSEQMASMFHTVLPLMLQGIEVFMSQHDIDSGARWTAELARQLEEESYGILFLTPTNLQSTWLHFEAGALTKNAEARACGVLLGDLKPSNVAPPLAQFQNRAFTRGQIKHLIRDIDARREKPLGEPDLELVFDKWWPELESEYQQATEASGKAESAAPERSERALLEEVLLRLRSLEDSSSPSRRIPVEDPDILLEAPITAESLHTYTRWRFPDRPPSDRVQRILLSDLDLGRYKTIGDLDNAVTRASTAVAAYAQEKPEWFQYGTDFITKALGFVDPDFRRRHRFAARTQEALDQYAHLVPGSEHMTSPGRHGVDGAK